VKVHEVMVVLSQCDPDMEVAIEQIFREHRSIQLRSIEILNNCLTFKDHYVRVSEQSVFIAFDGKEFNVPAICSKYQRESTLA
jgi:hypothetical protein